MRITELFYSLQGEGRLIGVPTTFVRTTGCHLRCSWCDATYTFQGGEEKSLDEIMDYVRAQPTKFVCYTGGEPLLQKQSWELVGQLLDEGFDILIETAGNIDFTPAHKWTGEIGDRLHISMDVKCPSSGMHERNELGNLEHLRVQDQLKFVIADREDYDYACNVLREHGFPPCPVFFNPVGGVDPKQLTDWVLAEPEPLPVRVGLQLHKLIWGDVPGV